MEYVLKNGLKVEIREVKVEDSAKVLEYMKIVNAETKNLTRDPEEFNMTLEQEQAFIERAIKSESDFIYTAWDNDVLISTSGIHGSTLNRLKHKVNLGISVLKKYHGLGLGYQLMELLTEKAIEMGKTKLELDVREDNPNAIHIYKKAGYEIEGIRKNGFYVDNKYVNLVLMGKILTK